MFPSLGTIREWWRLDAGTLKPTGDRSIGSSTTPVLEVFLSKLITNRVESAGSSIALTVSSADAFTVDSAALLPVGTKDLGSAVNSFQKIHASKVISDGIFDAGNSSFYIGGHDIVVVLQQRTNSPC